MGLVNPGYQEKPDWFKASFLDLREDVQEARQAGRRVLLYFYQDGCPYCKKLLDVNFSQRQIREKTQKYFDVIAINIWGDQEVNDLSGITTTEKQFSETLKVMFTPTMLFLDETGQVVMRLNGYYPPHKFEAVVDYAGQHKEKESGFREYWASHAPPAATGVLHQQDSYLQPPYRLASRNADKPLLVMFEQNDCVACDELHMDILKRKESRELLKQFDVVLLDIWSDIEIETPGAVQTTAAAWAGSLNVQYTPSMVMFDSGGKEVFRTEAYLKTFHTQAALDYVLSGAYREQPNFQRFIQAWADELEAQGIHVDLMQ
jgi:thioredoxin-related protein